MNTDPFNENPRRGLSASIDVTDTEACIQYFLERTEGLERYVLIDAYGGNAILSDLTYRGAPVDEWKQARLSVYTKTGGPDDPWLLNLNEDNTDFLLRRVLQLPIYEKRDETFPIGKRLFCALIGMEGDLKTLVWHLNNNASYLLPGREKSSAFRFFDPRVMHTLMRILTPQQRILLLGGARCWAYVDFHSRFRMRENTRYLAMSKVMFSPEQIEVLRYNSHVYQALRCLNEYREIWTEDTDAELVEHLRQTDLQLLDEDWNIAHYAALLWRVSQGLAKPEWLPIVLEEWTKHRIPLSTTLESLTPPKPLSEKERETRDNEIRLLNEIRAHSGQPLIPIPSKDDPL